MVIVTSCVSVVPKAKSDLSIDEYDRSGEIDRAEYWLRHRLETVGRFGWVTSAVFTS